MMADNPEYAAMDANDHLEHAQHYTSALLREEAAVNSNVPSMQLKAAQGRALRLVLFHGFAAVTRAIINTSTKE